MSNFDDIYQGFVIMVSFIFIGIILSFFGGYILDHVFATFNRAGILDVPPDWQSMGGTFTMMNIWYLVCWLFPVVGVAAFLKTIIRKQGYDQYLMQ